MVFRCFHNQNPRHNNHGPHIALENETQRPRKSRAQQSQAQDRPIIIPSQPSVPGDCEHTLVIVHANREETTKPVKCENETIHTDTPMKSKKSRTRTTTKDEVEVQLVAKARFEDACRLLHNQILEKEDRLTVSEISFLNRLLTDENSESGSVESSSDLTVDRLSAIESSIHRLKEDPLFTTPSSSPDRSLQSAQRIAFERRSRSQSPWDDAGSRVEVVSVESSHFSVGGALKSASVRPSRCIKISHANCGSLEQTIDLNLSQEFDDYDNVQGSSPLKTSREVNSLEDEDRRTNLDYSPYKILGTISEDRVLSAKLMEALRGFLPTKIAYWNYWLKFDTDIHESSMTSLLTKIRTSTCTIIAIKETSGTVFGSFTSSPWRLQKGWFGACDAFLFRSYDGKLEVYPYTDSDTHVQYCSTQILAVGGGAWCNPADSPYKKQPSGIGLLIDGDVRGGESNSCATFCNPKLFGRDGDCGGNEFSTEAMEVWTLTACDSVLAATASELKELFLEQGPVRPFQKLED